MESYDYDIIIIVVIDPGGWGGGWAGGLRLPIGLQLLYAG